MKIDHIVSRVRGERYLLRSHYSNDPLTKFGVERFRLRMLLKFQRASGLASDKAATEEHMELRRKLHATRMAMVRLHLAPTNPSLTA